MLGDDLNICVSCSSLPASEPAQKKYINYFNKLRFCRGLKEKQQPLNFLIPFWFYCAGPPQGGALSLFTHHKCRAIPGEQYFLFLMGNCSWFFMLLMLFHAFHVFSSIFKLTGNYILQLE